jgi:cobalt/nickel transport system permease protein
MLYRYIFVLIEEAIRMLRAHTLRSFSTKKMRYQVFKQMLGNLLLRTIDRAQRIHLAMLSRAFTGEIKIARRYNFSRQEIFYVFSLLLLFSFMRFFDISGLLGNLLLEFSS